MIICALGNTLEYNLLSSVVAGLGPPNIILVWLLKSSIAFTSVKNSGLKTKFNESYKEFHLAVVPGDTVDFMTIVFLVSWLVCY